MLPPRKQHKNRPSIFWYFAAFVTHVIRLLKELSAQKSRRFFPINEAQKSTFKCLIFCLICYSSDFNSQRTFCSEITSILFCKLSTKSSFNFLIFRYICYPCDTNSQRILCFQITSIVPCELSTKADFQILFVTRVTSNSQRIVC